MDNLHPVEKVFSDNIFKIPDYQRGYAWGATQCRDFLEDINLLENGRSHYLGTLILQKNDTEPRITDDTGQSYVMLEVIDGQQRLTTIVLLMLAIHDKMEPLGLDKLRDRLRRNFLVVHDRNGSPLAKLHLNQDSDDYFQNVILGLRPSIAAPKIASEKRLGRAKQQFTDYLDEQEKLRGPEFKGWLEDLYLKIMQQMKVLLFDVGSSAEAGVVFETMNNRGKAITELEKVKNYLLYLAGHIELEQEHQLAAEINATWQRLFEHLMAAGLDGTGNEDQLLRVHWLMAYDPDPKKWQQSRSVKDRFDLRAHRNNPARLLQDIYAYLASLDNACRAYCDIRARERDVAYLRFRDQKELRAKLQAATTRLQRLGVRASFLPYLMATLINEDGPAMLHALETAERYTFRVYSWAGKRANTGQSTLYRLGHHLYVEDLSPAAADAELRRAALHYCSDQRFDNRFDIAGENWYSWGGLKYFLYEYEQHLADRGGYPVRMPWEQVQSRKNDTIEHILPQTFDRYGYWRARFSDEEHRLLSHDIGNLTLTYDNSALSNRPFNDLPEEEVKGKRSSYDKSPLFSEKEIAAAAEWLPTSILARRDQIRAWATMRWHVEQPPAPPASDPAVPGSRRVRKKRTLAAIQAKADANGLGESFTALVAFLRGYGIGIRPMVNCFYFSPPQDGRVALGAVWPGKKGLAIGIWNGRVAQHLNLPPAQVSAIIGDQTRFNPADHHLPELLRILAELFAAAGLKPPE